MLDGESWKCGKPAQRLFCNVQALFALIYLNIKKVRVTFTLVQKTFDASLIKQDIT